MTKWFVYMIRCRFGSLYTGITTDIERRFAEHCEGRGARALRGREPLQVVFCEPAGDRALASRTEAAIKKLPKTTKEKLAAGTLSLETLFGQCTRDG